MTIQTFTPDKVLVSEKKDGTLHKEFTDIIMKEVAENSLVMQRGKYHEMKQKKSRLINLKSYQFNFVLRNLVLSLLLLVKC